MEEKKESIEDQRKKLSGLMEATMENEDVDKLHEALVGYANLIARTLGQMRPYEIPLIWAALNRASEVLLADMTLGEVDIAQKCLQALHAAAMPEVEDNDTM